MGLQFGPDQALQTYREVRAVEVAGSHFAPASNRYVVHYCVEYTHYGSDEVARRFDLNVHVYELDSKQWVGFATGVGSLYRWQVIELSAPAAKADEAPDAPKTDSPAE